MPEPSEQAIDAPLSSNATFVTLNLGPKSQDLQCFRDLCADLPGLIRSVGFRSAAADLSCNLGIGASLWPRLGMKATPAGLHPFREISGVHHAPATDGDFFLHIRASRPDFCFALLSIIMSRLAGAVDVIDETVGFKFFDNRDLLGFVDGTENPNGAARGAAVFIGDEDPDFAGGSYVITQKYLHDLGKWEAMTVEAQSKVIGRHKLSDVEIPDDKKVTYAHNVLTSLTDDDGNAIEILRDNMPFGSAAEGEFGTYFIGYAREPGRIETMLDNMFLGKPAGNYDRILDVSRAVTGALFFVPSADLLDQIGAAKGK
ncbi:Dyp-type peroxidase [Paracoccus sp. (in: a-proteobacteria)]|uniref:Dyp-type peroxidase n=1 Tax=Paracoccus sp. TaxID=267 RepID=UPI0028A035B4|nr:Dyp-type peroxidase [Paracoccus sp. (in: a-proteobacteria)]